MSERTRTRYKACCIQDCEVQVRRGEDFGICTDHLLRIWRQIDRERKRMGYKDDDLYGVPENRDLNAGQGVMKVAEVAQKIKSKPSHAQEGTLYVVDTGVQDGVKIGWTSRDVWRRLAEYPPTFRVIVTASGTRADERDLHRSLKLFRMEGMGKEWYHANNGEVVRAINDLIRRGNIERQQANGRAAQRDAELAEGNLGYFVAMKERFQSLDEWRSGQPESKPSTPGPKSSWGRLARL